MKNQKKRKKEKKKKKNWLFLALPNEANM